MSNTIIPQNFEEWYHCITVKCAIKLTSRYVDDRIELLKDTSDFRTQQFIKLYGEHHHQSVLNWFNEAKNRL